MSETQARAAPTADPSQIGRIIAQSAEFSIRNYPGVTGLVRSFAGALVARLEAANTLLALTPDRIAPFEPTSIREADFSRYICYQLTLEGAGEPAALFVELPIFYGWFELVAGGSASEEISIPRRPPSILEMETGLSLARAAADGLIAVFEGQSAIGPISITPAAIGKALEQLADTVCFQIALAHAGGSVPGEIMFALPVKLVDHLRARADRPQEPPPPVRKAAPPREDEAWTKQFRKSISSTQLNLDVVVGLSELTLEQVAMLTPGSRIKLSSGPADAVVESNGKPLITAELGQSGGRFMLRYKSQVKERTVLDADGTD